MSEDDLPKVTVQLTVNAQTNVDKPVETQYTEVLSSGIGFLIVNTNNAGKFRLSGGTLAWRNNNPGNLRAGSYCNSKGAIGKDHGNYAVFPTFELGKKAQYDLLFGPNSRYNSMTLEQAIYTYAPPVENNTKEYLNFVCRATKLAKTSRISTMTDKQKDDLLAAMFKLEGYKVGNKEKV